MFDWLLNEPFTILLERWWKVQNLIKYFHRLKLMTSSTEIQLVVKFEIDECYLKLFSK